MTRQYVIKRDAMGEGTLYGRRRQLTVVAVVMKGMMVGVGVSKGKMYAFE